MRHVSLMCSNHPQLRWSTKEVAVAVDNQGGYHYNGQRNLFFCGETTGTLYGDGSGVDCVMVREDGSWVEECNCPSSALVRAPEDVEIERRLRAS